MEEPQDDGDGEPGRNGEGPDMETGRVMLGVTEKGANVEAREGVEQPDVERAAQDAEPGDDEQVGRRGRDGLAKIAVWV